MTKISLDHLARSAVVYVRQSTAEQVAHNLESQRRQYGLAERARLLGWHDVEVIDDDLGRSAGGVRRPGFERLLAAICEGRVGAVMSVEASRLARNGRDWHTLLEFCGLVGTIIVDEDGVYDPASPNDRLLLGMKGTMSEMELSVFRQRSIEAMKQKARRGELFLTVAVGYVKTGRDLIEKDPDRRVQDAIGLVFRRYAELQSIRQVLVWFRQEKIPLPVLTVGEAAERMVWKAPVYSTVHHILTNPVYAGAYAFGRRTMRVVIENGRKHVLRNMQRDWRSWSVLIPDHHESYISWTDFERNQTLIADNANGKRFMSRGAIRRGEALLVGLFRCARCGRKLRVRYSDGADAINASAHSLTWRRPAASASAECAPTGWSPRRCSSASNPWAWRRPWRRLTPGVIGARRSRDSSNSRFSKPAMRRLELSVSTMRPIRTIGSWPASWSDVGTSG